MPYIACYVAAVPTDKKDIFAKHAAAAAKVFEDHGATRVVDCWGTDVPPGELTSFPLSVQADEGETVVVGWQEWPDKTVHDAGMAEAMKDPRISVMRDIPMDGKRLIFGGFETLRDG